jgi:hypothetical protein
VIAVTAAKYVTTLRTSARPGAARHRPRLLAPARPGPQVAAEGDLGADPAARRREAAGEVGAVEIAQRTGVSRGTARRYLEYLAATGAIELTLRYGAAGRPEHLDRWADRVTG